MPLHPPDGAIDDLGSICGTGPNDLYLAHTSGLLRSAGDGHWIPETVDPSGPVRVEGLFCAPGTTVVFVATGKGVYRSR